VTVLGSSFKEIRAEVLKRINPSESERKKVQDLAKMLTSAVEKEAKERKMEADVRVEGSVAKNTWLRDCPEIDVFIQVPKTLPREAFETVCLEIAKKATEGYEQIERFAEHPYLEAIIDNVWVNIVPCFKVNQGEWVSATDRTPFHTDYVKKYLDEKLGEETRLLKRFMKGIGSYGAEIKVGGFSGYLCELLVLHYGSFAEVLQAAGNWKEPIIIDHKRYYKNREDIDTVFEESLVMVDPVDKERNVAAAVRKDRLDEFIAASREFMKSPNIEYFYPTETVALKKTELVNKIKERASAIVFITFGGSAVPDILWGQLYKSQKALQNIITNYDFKILGDAVWSDEKNHNVFVFELESRFLPNMKHHIGPPLENRVGCESFLQKHIGAGSTVSGPRIENGRWIVDVKRQYTDVVELLSKTLGEGGRCAGVAEMVSGAIVESVQILVNDDVADLYSLSAGFAMFLTEYLEGKPRWLSIS
jgi:tRNA nucleotidyltransferase (CCA-adding enzyme)